MLTAIVIGFALFVFALAVLKRSWETHGNVETDRITAVAEEPAPDLAVANASGAAARAPATAASGAVAAALPPAAGDGEDGTAAGARA